jgi:serine/threonine protein kinase/DNA-binding CsgD family transcriptional regulator
MLAPNTLLKNRYLIVEQIGKGGMGAVYRAIDKTFDSMVAIKETFFTDDHLRKAFEREARLLNRLRHAALPVVIDYFFEGDGQFLVMQFIAGNDLGGMLDKRKNLIQPLGKPKPFAVDEVIPWVEQLLDALDYLHTQTPPVIHRDIKPQNLKLTQRGEIILLDFGLAKGAATQLHATSSGSIFGYTPNYAPLEQIHGSGTDGRSDLYSLAATVYHLLTGETPVGALARATAILSGNADPLPPLQRFNPQVPQNLAAILMRTLSQNPNERPQNAAEMLAAWRAAKEYLQPRRPTAKPEVKAEPPQEANRFTIEIHSDKPTTPKAIPLASSIEETEEITRQRPLKTKSDKLPEQTAAKPIVDTKAKAPAKEKPVDLAPRRQEILALLAQELKDAEIARQIGVESKVLSEYLTKLRHDIGVITRKDLVIWAMTQVKTSKETNQVKSKQPSSKSAKAPAGKVSDSAQKQKKKTDAPTAAKIIDIIEQSQDEADDMYLPTEFLKKRFLELLVQGLSDEEIARKQLLQPGWVKKQINNLEREAGVITRKDLILWAMKRGIKAPSEGPPSTGVSSPSKFSAVPPVISPPAKLPSAKKDEAQPAAEKKETILGNFLQAIGFGFFAFLIFAAMYYITSVAVAIFAFILGCFFALTALGALVTMFGLMKKK